MCKKSDVITIKLICIGLGFKIDDFWVFNSDKFSGIKAKFSKNWLLVNLKILKIKLRVTSPLVHISSFNKRIRCTCKKLHIVF